ncbi:MAG: CvpA family protein [Eubacteriales bacterium]|nr:CvpA family protein [Eubacteriales bacterium]
MTWTWLGAAALVVLAVACAVGYYRGFVKEIVTAFFTVLSFLIIWSINPHINEFIREKTPVYRNVQEYCREMVRNQAGDGRAVGQQEQNRVVEELGLPKLLQEGLLKNNNAQVYRYLAVTTFGDYVADYLSILAVNGISFLISFLLVTLVTKAVVGALHILTMLPVVHGANKLAGGLVGGIKCIVFLWVALLALMLLCGTEFGRKGMELVEQDVFLSFLNRHNILIQMFTGIFYGR